MSEFPGYRYIKVDNPSIGTARQNTSAQTAPTAWLLERNAIA